MRRKRNIFDALEEMRRLFDETLTDSPMLWEPKRALTGTSYPARSETYSDMVETEKDVIFTAELPGVKKEDININVTENMIEISTESKEEQEEKSEEGYSYYSRYSGFRSSYPTPVPINAEEVKATYKNGVLEVRAPKKEVKKTKKIKVE